MPEPPDISKEYRTRKTSQVVIFNADDQSNLVDIATDIAGKILWENGGNMPKVPWLSQNGQVKAFNFVVEFIKKEIINNEYLSYDQNARSGVLFWTLTLIYANHRFFRVSTSAAKKDFPITLEVRSWLGWIGSELHPSIVVKRNAPKWKSKSRNPHDQEWNQEGLKTP